MAVCFLLGCIGFAICAMQAWHLTGTLWRAYLVGYLSWWAVAIGGAGLAALGNLTGGRWAEAGRPCYVAAMQTIPILAVLFIPLAFGLPHIYPWANASAEHDFGFSEAKAAYLSAPFFLVRSASYFLIWIVIVRWLSVVSQFNRRPAGNERMRRTGAISLVVLVPTATFAAFDWAMSLEPAWYSSIYGAIITAGGVVAVQSLAIISTALAPRIRRPTPPTGDARAGHLYDDENSIYGDFGNLQLAFVMMWTYFSFSQFLIIWYGNLPTEVTWYQRRLDNGWQYLALAIVFFCFVFPFASLLSRERKRSIGQLAVVAAVIFSAYGLNMYWTLVPAFRSLKRAELVAYVAAMFGFGGIWMAIYFFSLSRMRIERPPTANEG